jgi:hypothetical protein
MWIIALYIAAIASPFIFPKWFFRTLISKDVELKPLQASYFVTEESDSSLDETSDTSCTDEPSVITKENTLNNMQI